MLSMFPQLLFLAPLSTSLLRIAAGITLAYAAYRIIGMKNQTEHTDLPIIGEPSEWMVWLSAAITMATGIALFAGYRTQLTAIIATVITLKHLIGTWWYPSVIPLSRGTYALLLVISFSLIFSGAGALAFDLPL